jgi:hypothetical protein
MMVRSFTGECVGMGERSGDTYKRNDKHGEVYRYHDDDQFLPCRELVGVLRDWRRRTGFLDIDRGRAWGAGVRWLRIRGHIVRSGRRYESDGLRQRGHTQGYIQSNMAQIMADGALGGQ